MSSDMLELHAVYAHPRHSDGKHLPAYDSSFRVHFRHPGYSDSNNILIILPGLDHAEGGIHVNTAQIACAILANNRWDGYFTELRNGPQIDIGPNGVLRGKDYYFQVPDAVEGKYPIVPSFFHWQFPHSNLPEPWAVHNLSKPPTQRQLPRQSSLTEALLARDISCRVTNHIEGTEHAHLVPRSEELWFSQNGMFQYTQQQRPGTEPIDDSCNAILLRSDIHTIFDQKRLVLVPKISAFVVHILAPGSTSELVDLYHNVQLQPLAGVAVEYLFARFAWAVFTLAANFLQQGYGRMLVVRGENGEIRETESTGDQCRQFSLSQGTKTRSQSPRKRQREVNGTTAAEEDLDVCGEDNIVSRGRTLKRSYDMFSTGSSYRHNRSTSREFSDDTDVDLPDESPKASTSMHPEKKRSHVIEPDNLKIGIPT